MGVRPLGRCLRSRRSWTPANSPLARAIINLLTLGRPGVQAASGHRGLRAAAFETDLVDLGVVSVVGVGSLGIPSPYCRSHITLAWRGRDGLRFPGIPRGYPRFPELFERFLSRIIPECPGLSRTTPDLCRTTDVERLAARVKDSQTPNCTGAFNETSEPSSTGMRGRRRIMRAGGVTTARWTLRSKPQPGEQTAQACAMA
jgi:hypothetical protein